MTYALDPVFKNSPTPGPRSHMNQGLLLSEAISNYGDWQYSEGHRQSTRDTAASHLKHFLAWCNSQGIASLERADPMAILKYLRSNREAGKSDQTVRTRYTTLSSFFTFCVNWRFIDEHPIKGKIGRPKVDDNPKPFLTSEQWKAMLAVCPLWTFMGARRQLMLWLLMNTGIRCHELWSIKQSDVNLADKQILVRAETAKGRRYRLIPISDEARRAYDRYRELWLRPRRRKPIAHDVPELWVTEERQPITFDAFCTDMKRVMDYAGVKVKDPFHIFRRTASDNMERAGVDGLYIDLILGWRTPAMRTRYRSWRRTMVAQALEESRKVKPFPDEHKREQWFAS